ncbi:uncharacterized protein LOC132645682 isoform X2 [Lycium barbarum]|uniref:uncharacterized protein LOC132645682 isoform X2 n=1 Tax=Lycium barbarum TaxID=112863 RepID=UPI00293E8FB6|nr:uncharacterized protein LOC132645682 isoform X2 [Lycium barbarum]
MGEESSKPKSSYTKDTIISKELSEEAATLVDSLFTRVRLDGANFLTQYDAKDSFSELTRGCLKNLYNSMHGGAVGAVAEKVSIACARTLVGKDKELFLGELGMSYISAAPSNAEVRVDGSVIRSGRNLTVVAVEFRLKDSGKLVYTSNATFYHMPVASL